MFACISHIVSVNDSSLNAQRKFFISSHCCVNCGGINSNCWGNKTLNNLVDSLHKFPSCLVACTQLTLETLRSILVWKSRAQKAHKSRWWNIWIITIVQELGGTSLQTCYQVVNRILFCQWQFDSAPPARLLHTSVSHLHLQASQVDWFIASPDTEQLTQPGRQPGPETGPDETGPGWKMVSTGMPSRGLLSGWALPPVSDVFGEAPVESRCHDTPPCNRGLRFKLVDTLKVRGGSAGKGPSTFSWTRNDGGITRTADANVVNPPG